MHRVRFLSLLLVPAFALATAGCGGKPTGAGATTSPSDAKGGSGGAAAKKDSVALETKGTGIVKGKVIYDGETPKPTPLAITGGDAEKCKKGETNNLTWEVDPNTKGVKNVVVWIKPGEGKFFKPEAVAEAKKRIPGKVELTQPHCNYLPHVLAYVPSVWDGKQQVTTGSKFVATNTSDGIGHNVDYSGHPGIPENTANKVVNVGSELQLDLKPARDDRTGEDIVNLSCKVHGWMTGKVVVLDTPFYAVTDKDGNFEIKDVPAGAEVYIAAYHEDAGKNGFLLPAGTAASKQGEKITVKAGETTTIPELKIKKN